MIFIRSIPMAFGLAVALGITYWLLMPWQPWSGSWVLKPLPMLIYAGLAWRHLPGMAGRYVSLGFIAAAAGDFFLDYGQRDGLFMQALLAFLVNQVLFILGFAALAKGKPIPWRRCLPVIAYSVLLAVWLVPQAEGLRGAVSLYLLALLSMAIMASRLEDNAGPIFFGAMLFVLADSLIGVNKFAQPFPYAIAVIVGCYFTGQTLIAWGLLRRKRVGSV